MPFDDLFGRNIAAHLLDYRLPDDKDDLLEQRPHQLSAAAARSVKRICSRNAQDDVCGAFRDRIRRRGK